MYSLSNSLSVNTAINPTKRSRETSQHLLGSLPHEFHLPLTMPSSLFSNSLPSPPSNTHTMPPPNSKLTPPSSSMDPKPLSSFLLFFLLSSFLAPLCSAGDLRTYIIQLHPLELPDTQIQTKEQWHLSFLKKAVLSDEQVDIASRLLYSYHSALEGFATRLTDDEAVVLRALPGVASVRFDTRIELHTTYSYRFLGLGLSPGGAWARSGFGRNAIIGILDTGVWPESPSFCDDGMPPVPARWRGACQKGESFNSTNCNRKLIGARFYTKGHRANAPPPEVSVTEYVSPRDAHGHGTHTSSTAAGVAVPGASVLGVGTGNAMGTAPGAHIAAYKVCWFNGCYSSDILAGMDDAIQDGVDVLSLSLGGFPIPLFEDSIAIGSFRAMERGVAVVCAAGNNGPVASSVANEAPWITTVGASTMDRRFPAFLRLGNGETLYGESIHPANRFSNKGGKQLELVYDTRGNSGAEFCFKGSLSKARIGGKIVVCDRGINGRAEKGESVRDSGGVAMILANGEINQEEDSIDAHVLPASMIGYQEAIKLKSYINSTRRPVARLIFEGTRVGRARAPAVALFSARGPSLTNPSVLKPDIISPGVNIIAAWPGSLGPSGLQEDRRRSNFSILSGTSMACPHVSGIVALLRSVHPSWSPAMIKSAIMTTADVADHYGKPIMDGEKPAGVFAMGAGHVNPTRVLDPGLVYDIVPDDYISYLCTLGYSRLQIFTITHRNISCHENLQRNKHFSLNYPSISVAFKNGKAKVVMVQRTATNVGQPNSTYSVQVTEPEGVKVRVMPQVLTFGSVNERKRYRVWFESRSQGAKEGTSAEGHLIWVHGEQSKYKVRSPISVNWVA